MPVTKLKSNLPDQSMDEATFNEAVGLLMSDLPLFGDELTALEANVVAKSKEVVTNAQTATTKAAEASASAKAASDQRVAAQLAASDADGFAKSASDSAAAVARDAAAAQTSAAAAAVAADSLTATSTTPVEAGTGEKVFVIGPGKRFPNGEIVAITSKGAPGVRMFGPVKSYVGADLTVMVDGVEGDGTRADWLIGPGGQRGKQGNEGKTGGVNGGNLAGLLAEKKAENILAAATTNVWATGGNSATLVGSTAVVSFGEAPQPGAKFTLIAGAATPLTNGANLVLPGGVNYTTTAGDRLEIFAETTTKMDVSIFKADGTPVIGGATYVTRTANVILTRSDSGKFIDIVSGTFTQTFDSLANLPAGWAVWIRNSGSGDITIPASDGRTNWIMYTSEIRLFMKDQATGTLKSAVLKGFDRIWTSLSTFIKPPGYLDFEGELWSGGDGGTGGEGSRGSGYGGKGAKGGDWVAFSIPANLVNETETIVVGAGGNRGAGGVVTSGNPPFNGTPGGPGGISWFGSLVSSVPGYGPFVAGTEANLSSKKSGAGGGTGGGTLGASAAIKGQPGGVSALAGSGGPGGDYLGSATVTVGTDGGPGVAPGGGGGGGGGGGNGGNGGNGGLGARGQVRVKGVA